MMPLPNKRIGKSAQKHLKTIQAIINKKVGFAVKFATARDMWKEKESKNAGKVVFDRIRSVLTSMDSRRGMCHYCEMNEVSPIEHVFPKRHFPERTFKWDNFLRSCHNCNSVHKGDKFAIFYPIGSSTVYNLIADKAFVNIPPNNDQVFINPRCETPQDYMMLDLFSGVFIPVPGVDARGKEKAKYTYETLGLNTRDNLIRLRKKAYSNYIGKLEKYVTALSAKDFSELAAAVRSPLNTTINNTISFKKEKKRLLNFIKNDICDDSFPTVWLELKNQRALIPNVDDLFQQAPEALYW